MTNSKHLVKCPFYEYEKVNFVKCEDVKRIFKSVKEKDDYMYKFCDVNWMKCEHALRLHHAYEEGRDMEEVKIESLKSENRKLERRLKQAEARNEAKDEEIRKLRNRCKGYEQYRDKYLQLAAHEKKVYEEITAMTTMYEARFAYLMSTRCDYCSGNEDPILNEKEMEEWSKGKEFAIIADKVEDDKVVQWRAIVRLQDDQDDDTTESEDEEEQSEDSDEPEDRQTDDRPEH